MATRVTSLSFPLALTLGEEVHLASPIRAKTALSTFLNLGVETNLVGSNYSAPRSPCILPPPSFRFPSSSAECLGRALQSFQSKLNRTEGSREPAVCSSPSPRGACYCFSRIFILAGVPLLLLLSTTCGQGEEGNKWSSN